MVTETARSPRLKFKLRDILKDRRMSQAEVAVLAGIDHSTINGFITGRRGVRESSLVKLCDALECQVSDLLEVIPAEK